MTHFPWRPRLSTLRRVPGKLPVPGDGNCMLHAWIVTFGSDIHVDELRANICRTMRASTPSDVWRRDELYDLQAPTNVDREALEWERLATMAEPAQRSPPYLRWVHARALAINTGVILVLLTEHSSMRIAAGSSTQTSLTVPDLVTVFLPDPESDYAGVQESATSHRGRDPTTHTYSGNRFTWEDFLAFWHALPPADKNTACILIFDGGQLHYSGTRLQVE